MRRMKMFGNAVPFVEAPTTATVSGANNGRNRWRMLSLIPLRSKMVMNTGDEYW
jgi:hypothetical protein